MTDRDSAPLAPASRSRAALLRWLFVGLAVAAAFAAVHLAAQAGIDMPLSTLDPVEITAWIKSFGHGAVFASLLVMILCALTVLPAEVPALANGMIFGPVIGGLITWVGAMIGANIAFGIARFFGPGLIDRWVSSEQSQRYQQAVGSRGAVVLLIARCIPLIPFFAVNYLAGAASMRLWTFNWVTAIGILPMTIALVTMGDQAMHMPWFQWLALAVVLVGVLLILRAVYTRSKAAGYSAGIIAPDTADEVDVLK